MNPSAAFLGNIQASRILVVDDVDINRLVIENTLRARGFQHISTAKNGQEALDHAVQPPPDMIILDIQMPVMDGFECCTRLRGMDRHQDTPILIQTVLTQPEMRVKAFMHGATDIISKPIDPDEMYARILVHLEKQHCLRALRAYFARTSSELNQARELQRAMLPTAGDVEDVRRRYRLDIASHFQPSSEIGGDFWGMKHLFPQQLALWMVDFSGHGVGAAINAFRLQAYLQEHSPLAARPGDYLTQLNEKLLDLLELGEFATMFYGVLDMQGRQLLYAGAGSPHPLLFRHASGDTQLIDATGLPLGFSLHSYPTRTLAFHPGDQLLMYSDALTETADAAGQCTGEAALQAMLQRHGNGSAQQLIAAVLEAAILDRQSHLRDDLTVCACRWQTDRDVRW